MHYELCIMNYALRIVLWRSGFAVGLSAISLLAMFPSRFPKSRSHSPIPFPFSLPQSHSPFPKSRSRFPNPNPAPLAKDAAPIPNALAATSIKLRAMSKITPNS